MKTSWIILKTLFLLLILGTMGFFIESTYGFWPSLSFSLIALVIMQDRVQAWFQKQEDWEYLGKEDFLIAQSKKLAKYQDRW